MNLLAKLGNNAAIIICIILTTILLVKLVEIKDLDEKLVVANRKAAEYSSLSLSLTKRVNTLAKELEETPERVITLTKEVQTEVCNGKLKQEAIKNLPSKKEVVNEKDVADIDDRIPSDLIKLLK